MTAAVIGPGTGIKTTRDCHESGPSGVRRGAVPGANTRMLFRARAAGEKMIGCVIARRPLRRSGRTVTATAIFSASRP
jgi:hypothetical protein